MRNCGDCTLCCLFMKVPETNSPEYEYCAWCDPGMGCFVYEDRWDICKSFGCLWYLQEHLPDFLRPDRLGVMFEVTFSPNLILGYVDPQQPDCWAQAEVRKMIGKIVAANYSVILSLGKGKQNKIFPRRGKTNNDVLRELMKVELHGRSLIHN